jgi:hypothetical protein
MQLIIQELSTYGNCKSFKITIKIANIHSLPTSMTVNSKITVFHIYLTFRNESPHLLCCVWILVWQIHLPASIGQCMLQCLIIFSLILSLKWKQFCDIYLLINKPFTLSQHINKTQCKYSNIFRNGHINLHITPCYKPKYILYMEQRIFCHTIWCDGRQCSTCHYSNHESVCICFSSVYCSS